ncbi:MULTISPECIES: hypothetical protein [Methylobacterium]|uniref:hypothetical protein n=1 Tax=Methylobacterium TaxID=407 RepID=UPI001404E36E|nr:MULTISPECIES: hypothetical protein [Methylobacterium]MDR7040617.1 hypothetical protein [Methylobacterium sp. BE186]
MTDVFDLLDADQREEAAQAGLAELQAALASRTPEERAAFWKAINTFYVPPPEDQDD